MAQLMDCVQYLAKEIGPRPAGTEEEHKAALYITEQFQQETGFAANIEEYSTSSNLEAGFAIVALITIVVTILAMLFPVLAIPAFILAALAAAIYALEAYGRPVISQLLARGVSQNVVAKYQPAGDAPDSGHARTRKVVLVAHYDTGRVEPPLISRLRATGAPLDLVCVIGMAVAAFLLLVRAFVGAGGGMALVFLNVLSVVALLVCVFPVVKALLLRAAPYNEGANNNATGAAALLEVARRISRGSVSEAELANAAGGDVRIHGEQAAIEAGLVPEGAQIRYEAEQLTPPNLGEYDDEERLLAAKAAIASLTGKPVERRVFGSVADKLVNSRVHEGDEYFAADDDFGPGFEGDLAQAVLAEGGWAAGESEHAFSSPSAAPVQPAAPASVPPAEAGGFSNAPSWFVAAQQNAKRPVQGEGTIQRSRYTEAIEHAERELAERERAIADAERERREAEQRARQEAARAALLAQEDASSEPAEGEPSEAEQPAEAAHPEQAEAADGVPGAPIQPVQPVQPIGQSAPEAPTPSAGVPSPGASPDAARAPRSRQAITLPEVNSSAPSDAPAPSSRSNRAPAARESISSLPDIGADGLSAGRAAHAASATAPAESAASDSASSGRLRNLRANLPSLSGVIRTKDAARKAAAASVPNVVNVPTPIEPAPSASAQGGSRSSAASSDEVDYNMAVPTDLVLPAIEQEEDPDVRGDRDDPGRTWQGGAYSRTQLGHVDMRSGEDAEADKGVFIEPVEDEPGRSITGEIEQIYHFRNPLFGTEVWFVAIGSDNASHEGAKAFLSEHRDELRGSMVIEVESLGAGTLSVASKEGRLKKVAASSRIKRYIRNAVSATGISPDEVALAGEDSIASTVQAAGFQAMHLFGAENGRPALKGSADDVLENVDELILDDNVNFIYELLKH